MNALIYSGIDPAIVEDVMTYEDGCSVDVEDFSEEFDNWLDEVFLKDIDDEMDSFGEEFTLEWEA